MTRFKIRGPFGGHESENFVQFQPSPFSVVYTWFYSKFNGEFKFLSFNTNGGLEHDYFYHSLHHGKHYQCDLLTVANIIKLLINPKGKRDFVTPSYSKKVVCAVKIIHQMMEDVHDRQETSKLINAIFWEHQT